MWLSRLNGFHLWMYIVVWKWKVYSCNFCLTFANCSYGAWSLTQECIKE